MDDSIRLLKIKEAATLLGVSPTTLRKWDKEGKLVAIRISERGDRRYKKEDIEKFLDTLKN
jgi:excisionase family DNA binding protein